MLKWAGLHRVADPTQFDLPGIYRVSQSLVYSNLTNDKLHENACENASR